MSLSSTFMAEIAKNQMFCMIQSAVQCLLFFFLTLTHKFIVSAGPDGPDQ